MIKLFQKSPFPILKRECSIVEFPFENIFLQGNFSIHGEQRVLGSGDKFNLERIHRYDSAKLRGKHKCHFGQPAVPCWCWHRHTRWWGMTPHCRPGLRCCWRLKSPKQGLDTNTHEHEVSCPHKLSISDKKDLLQGCGQLAMWTVIYIFATFLQV